MLSVASPHYSPWRLILFLLLSGLLHAVLIFCLPDLNRLFNIHLSNLSLTDNRIAVSLMESKPPPPKPKLAAKSAPVLAEDQVASLVDARLNRLPAFPALGDSPLPPAAPLRLPERSANDDLDQILPPPTSPAAHPEKFLGELNTLSLGQLSGRRLGGALGPVVSGAKSPVASLLSPEKKRKLLTLKPAASAPESGNFGLSGPVARIRKVLYRPPLPRISLTRDVSVKLKFWVRPDGSISRVETVKIGDLELVNVAEKYLQQWRFSILPAELPQKEQWGTVTVVFRVSR